MARQSSPSNNANVILDAGLFDQAFYQRQRSDRFPSLKEAFDDFLEYGVRAGLSPHPLFAAAFYTRRNPDVAVPGVNPVLHYLLEGWREGRDPHPLFDNQWYAEQLGSQEPTCPLSHYVGHADRRHASPNPLFDARFYTQEHGDIAKAGVNPLVHYVLYGRTEGRLPAARFRALLSAWRDAPTPLQRGGWKREHTLWILFRRTGSRQADDGLSRLVQYAHHAKRFDVRVLVDGEGPPLSLGAGVKVVYLDEFGVHLTSNQALRPSSLRLLLFALTPSIPHVDLWQNVDEPRVTDALIDIGLTVSAVTHAVDSAGSENAFGSQMESMIEGSPLRLARTAVSTKPCRRVFVPCADWSLSGVHTVAEALGRELITRGWDFRLLFTRGTIGVLDRTTEGHGLPLVPYEFLDTSAYRSPREHWAAIIRYLEWRAPCVMLATFDDFANAVAPALSDRVGVVGWLQSDEDHYYESAHRLGRYWNAVAGVSRHIIAQAVRLNPSFEDRTHLIHNTTVRRDEALGQHPPAIGPDLRLIYVGRMVHYQKRILDVTSLVQHLERRGMNYRLTLVGASPNHDVEPQLRTALAGQLARGKVRLIGPLNPKQVLQELRAHNVFLLFSDFEGLPVSLIEAMACGCVPAVADIRSGIPDVVEHDENGLVFENRDYGAWAAALEALVRDPARMAAMSAKAQQTVREKFTVELMADRFEHVFFTVLRQIEAGTWTRPPALSWQSPVGDVLPPPSMYGTKLD